jgi:hypothetical protein
MLPRAGLGCGMVGPWETSTHVLYPTRYSTTSIDVVAYGQAKVCFDKPAQACRALGPKVARAGDTAAIPPILWLPLICCDETFA